MASEREAFFELIDRYRSADEAVRAAIADEIAAKWEQTAAVMCLDMSGLTRIVRSHGPVHYVAMIREMRIASEPVVTSAGGGIIKFDADNLYATFPSMEIALSSVAGIHRALADHNSGQPDERRIAIKVGLAYGPVISVPGWDAHGDAMNVASKLGEDTAKAGEVLIEDQAFQRLSNPPLAVAPIFETLAISGVSLGFHRAQIVSVS